MTTIAITGVSGGAGQLVLQRLADDPSVDRIIGIDARDPAFRPPSLEFHRLDLASTDLKSVKSRTIRRPFFSASISVPISATFSAFI